MKNLFYEINLTIVCQKLKILKRTHPINNHVQKWPITKIQFNFITAA